MEQSGRPPYRGLLLWLLLLPSVWARRSLLAFGAIAFGTVACELVIWRLAPYPLVLVPLILTALVIGVDRRLTRTSWWRLSILTILLVLAGQAWVQWWLPHYVSPVFPLILATMAAGLRRYSARLRAPAAIRLPQVIVIVALVHISGLLASGTFLRDRVSPIRTVRERVKTSLTHQGGSHLVFVRYSADYSMHLEWVYNDADLPNTPVLFAHDLGDSENRLLILSHRDRLVWRLSVSREGVQLQPY